MRIDVRQLPEGDRAVAVELKRPLVLLGGHVLAPGHELALGQPQLRVEGSRRRREDASVQDECLFGLSLAEGLPGARQELGVGHARGDRLRGGLPGRADEEVARNPERGDEDRDEQRDEELQPALKSHGWAQSTG